MDNILTANDKLLFEILDRGLEGNTNRIEDIKVRAAIRDFVFGRYEQTKSRIAALKSKVQSVAVSTDFPINITQMFNITDEKANYDMGYEAAFRDVPRDATKNFWEIVTSHPGLTFRRIPEGGRIRVEGMTGDLVYAYVDHYGGALGWTDAMIRWRQIALMYDRATAFRDAFFINKADNLYLLLATAASLHVTLWQAGATQLIRDLATLNLSSFNLGNVNKDKGYAVTGTTPFILYANPLDETRIEQAFAATNANLIMGGIAAAGMTGRPIRRVYTYNQFITARHPILVLPGQKIQKNEALAPTTYVAPEDILTLNRMTSVWSIYGAAVADDEQCMQINLE